MAPASATGQRPAGARPGRPVPWRAARRGARSRAEAVGRRRRLGAGGDRGVERAPGVGVLHAGEDRVPPGERARGEDVRRGAGRRDPGDAERRARPGAAPGERDDALRPGRAPAGCTACTAIQSQPGVMVDEHAGVEEAVPAVGGGLAPRPGVGEPQVGAAGLAVPAGEQRAARTPRAGSSAPSRRPPGRRRPPRRSSTGAR